MTTDIRVVEVLVRKSDTAGIAHYWTVQVDGQLLGEDYMFQYEDNARRCARGMIAAALKAVAS